MNSALLCYEEQLSTGVTAHEEPPVVREGEPNGANARARAGIDVRRLHEERVPAVREWRSSRLQSGEGYPGSSASA